MKRLALVPLALLMIGCTTAPELTLDITLPTDKQRLAAVTTLTLAAERDSVVLARRSFSSTAGAVSLAGVSHGAGTIFTLDGVNAAGTILAQGRSCAVDFEGAGTTAPLYFAPTNFFGGTANDPTAVRAAPAAMSLTSGHVLIAGGADGTVPLASSDLFTPGSTLFARDPVGADAGVANPAMNHARARPQGTPLPSIGLLVTGGVGGDGAVLSTTELYVEAEDIFLPTAPTIAPRVDHRAALLPDGRTLVSGGSATDGGAPLATTQFINVKSDGTSQVSFQVTDGPTLNEARRSHAMVVTVGVPFVIGGYGADGQPLSSIESIDPGTGGVAKIVAHLTTARAEATASLLADGSILIVGGVGTSGALDTFEIFNPVLPDKTQVDPIAVARHGHTATVLSDGRVLVAGGTGADGQALTSVEIFDPTDVLFATERPLTTARTGHVAVPLCDGTVLMVGGGAGAELYTGSAE